MSRKLSIEYSFFIRTSNFWAEAECSKTFLNIITSNGCADVVPLISIRTSQPAGSMH